MKLRKIFAILLALLVVLSFAACDGGGGGSSSDNGGNGGNGAKEPWPVVYAGLVGSGGIVWIRFIDDSNGIMQMSVGGGPVQEFPFTYTGSPLADGDIEIMGSFLGESGKVKAYIEDGTLFCNFEDGDENFYVPLQLQEEITDNGSNTGDANLENVLCFTASGDDVEVILFLTMGRKPADFAIPSLECSFDGKSWNAIDFKLVEIPPGDQFFNVRLIKVLTPGSKVYIRATGTNKYFSKVNNNDTSLNIQFFFNGEGKVAASGNIMSLLDKTGALTKISEPYCFKELFQSCYLLTTAPGLPATALAENCYESMFQNCTSLTKAPELPARTLAKSCYKNMFTNCESLNSIKVGFTSWNEDDECTSNWVSGVSGSGNFVCPEALYYATDASGSNTIPGGWTVNGKTVDWR